MMLAEFYKKEWDEISDWNVIKFNHRYNFMLHHIFTSK